MSFKWCFKINPENFSQDDLITYQEILREIRTEFKDYDGLGINISFYEDSECGPEDNIFATFSFSCSFHLEIQETNIWYLVWNPLEETNSDKLFGSFNRCAPEEFKELSDKILKKLSTCLPHCFDYTYQVSTEATDDSDDDDTIYLDSNEDNFGLLTDMGINNNLLFECCDIECGECLECNLGVNKKVNENEYYY
jgi:hypothetical protein